MAEILQAQSVDKKSVKRSAAYQLPTLMAEKKWTDPDAQWQQRVVDRPISVPGFWSRNRGFTDQSHWFPAFVRVPSLQNQCDNGV
jgi:hypothetical protein